MATQLRPWVRWAGIFVAIATFVGILGYFSTKNMGNNSSETTVKKASNGLLSFLSGGSSKSDDVITVSTNTYIGFLPLIYVNGGLEPNEQSIIYKKYGVKMKIIVQDDFTACRSGLHSGETDVVYCTEDVIATEFQNNSDMSDCRYFLKLNNSFGADAIVVDGSIQTVADLKGKSVAFAKQTASQTLLNAVLESNGLTFNDINIIDVSDGIAAAESFKADKTIKACVTWSPSDVDCANSRKGAKILTSTKDVPIVTDGLLAKAEWLDSNKENVKKFVSAILWANAEVSNNSAAMDEAIKLFADGYQFPIDEAKICATKVKYSTLADNINFFGLNPSFTGITAENIYNKMGRVYTSLGVIKGNIIPFRKVADSSIIEGLMASNDIDNDQKPMEEKKFTPVTKELEQAKTFSSKKVVIEFPVNSDVLDATAKSMVDSEIVDIVREFANLRIKLVGNCDNTGSNQINKPLSLKRANAVKDYLVREYSIDANRIVVVGQGSDKAIAEGSVGNNQSYRTTDVELIGE